MTEDSSDEEERKDVYGELENANVLRIELILCKISHYLTTLLLNNLLSCALKLLHLSYPFSAFYFVELKSDCRSVRQLCAASVKFCVQLYCLLLLHNSDSQSGAIPLISRTPP